MARNCSAAGAAQRSRSPSQSASCTLSSSSLRSTPSHFSCNPPKESGYAMSPNGSVDRLAISSDPDESSVAARKFIAGKSKAMPHASAIASQRVRVAEGSHLTPRVRASARRALKPARDRNLPRAMMGGEAFILLKARFWRKRRENRLKGVRMSCRQFYRSPASGSGSFREAQENTCQSCITADFRWIWLIPSDSRILSSRSQFLPEF